jgi:hypothetical protein
VPNRDKFEQEAINLRPDQRIVTKLPLSELWDDQGTLPERLIRPLSSRDIKELLRIGPVQFVLADCGANLKWIPTGESYKFWKSTQAQIADHDARAPTPLNNSRTKPYSPRLSGVGIVGSA